MHVLIIYLEILTVVLVRSLRRDNIDQVLLPRSSLPYLVQRCQPHRLVPVGQREIESLVLALQRLVDSIYKGHGMRTGRPFELDYLQCLWIGWLRLQGRPLGEPVSRSLIISRM